MGEHRLEKTIKDKLYNFDTPVDTSQIWAGIQSAGIQTSSAAPVPQAKKSESWRWSAFMLLSLLVGAIFIFGYDFMSTDAEQSNRTVFKNASTLSNSNNKAASIENNNTKETRINSTSDVVAQQNSLNLADANEVNAENDINQNSQAKAQKSIVTNRGSLTSSQKLQGQNLSTQATANDSSQKNKSINTGASGKNIENRNLTEVKLNSSSTGTTGVSSTIKSEENIGKTSDALSATSSSKESNRTDGSMIDNDSKNTTDGITSSTENQEITLSSLLPNYPSLASENTENFLGLRNKTVCYDDWNNKRKKFAIIPYLGVDMVTNKTAADETFVSYLEQRRSTMKFLEVLKGGLLFKYNVSPNIYLKAGGSYDQIKERFEHVSIEPSELILPDQVIAYQINMAGDTLPITGDGPVTVITTTTWVKHNEYHSFNIPVIIGYERFLGGDFSWYAEAGIFYNVSFKYKGTLLDSDNNVVSGDNFYLSSTGTSIYGAVGLNYMMSENVSATFNGSYRRMTNTINNIDFNPIEQNLGLVGLALGLEYRF